MKNEFYVKYMKRLLDIICALLALTAFCWVYLIVAVLVKKKLGSPVIYSAVRTGKDGKAFRLYKFRSMTDARDENGELLPDTERLTRFGRILRASSLDELPEAWNILIGNMSLIGPRPMPIAYEPYYTADELHRHDVRPGLSGLAQVNGRNSLKWEDKFAYDLEYVRNASFLLDVKIVLLTLKKVIIHENIGQGEEAPPNLYDIREKRE